MLTSPLLAETLPVVDVPTAAVWNLVLPPKFNATAVVLPSQLMYVVTPPLPLSVFRVISLSSASFWII